MYADLQNLIFNDENKAREALETIVWPKGRVCPHCGNVDQDKIAKAQGKAVRPGLYYCAACNGQFTATVGTVFERSKIPLTKWWLAMHLLGSSKKGISSHQLHRMLGVTYKTAWFMTHRIREAMREINPPPMGGGGKTVEVDETYIGRLEGVPKPKGGSSHKNVVLTLVERGGSARSFHIASVSIADMKPIIDANIARETAMMTDQGASYPEIAKSFASHDVVNHAREEYVRREGDKLISTNMVEGYYSIFKRGMKGVYQHCAREAFTPLSCRIRFPLQQPFCTWHRGSRARFKGRSGHYRKASDVSAH